MNTVVLMGRLTRDPETKHLPSGSSLVGFSLAVNRRVKGEDEASFFDCTAWEKTGELIAGHFNKGNRIIVRGRLQQRRWKTDDGQKRSKVEIVVEQFWFVDGKEDREPRNDQPLEEAARDFVGDPPADRPPAVMAHDIPSDEVPF